LERAAAAVRAPGCAWADQLVVGASGYHSPAVLHKTHNPVRGDRAVASRSARDSAPR